MGKLTSIEISTNMCIAYKKNIYIKNGFMTYNMAVSCSSYSGSHFSLHASKRIQNSRKLPVFCLFSVD